MSKHVRLLLGGLSVLVLVGAGCVTTTPSTAQPQAAPQAAASAGYTVGQNVEVEWNGTWYPSAILKVNSDGTYRIHYTGWADSWDEDVSKSRIR